jgi:very-short-patch-repair endonuclease
MDGGGPGLRQGRRPQPRSAAELWGLREGLGLPIHVSVPGSCGKTKRRGLLVHRSSSLTSSAVALRNRIAVTTPARTLRDLRRTERPELVRRAERQASFRGLEIGNEGGQAEVRSELERRFLRLLSVNELPMPSVNSVVGPYTVDFVWPAQRLVVETDGWVAHRGRQAFEDDRERDLYLRSVGYEVLRLSWRQVVEEPDRVVALLLRFLRGAVS